MDFIINDEELAALCGLSHIQQLAYLRGIRPYMDVKTGTVGEKRRISYQSIAEQLYVEPHQGTKAQSWSRDQIRRVVAGLERAGIVSVHSNDRHLILKCNLASRHFSVQNKAAINPPQKADTSPTEKNLVQTGLSAGTPSKPDTVEPPKAAIPLNKDNNYYFYLLSQFEQFWDLYPEKKSQAKAWEQFQALNPSPELCSQIINALQEQITFTEQQKNKGAWVAPWKYPANWLAQQCWNDELTMDKRQEKQYAVGRQNYSKQATGDSLFNLCKAGLEPEEESNVFDFTSYRNRSQAY